MSGEKKGITVKVDADLHAEIRQFLEKSGMTMGQFVALALQDELHPKIQMKEDSNMGNMRTIAFQVPEALYQRIKDYLQRNNMTQKEFMIGLIQRELDMDQAQREPAQEVESDPVEDVGELTGPEDPALSEPFVAESQESTEAEYFEPEDEDMSDEMYEDEETESMGMDMSMGM